MLRYGGKYVPEILMAPLEELTDAWEKALQDKTFHAELQDLLHSYVGRPTPVTRVKNFEEAIDAPPIYLKREDLNHTGAHKINNAIGQCLLAKRMGKTRIIAETGAGQHGLATATACAHFGLECVIYMGSVDAERQRPNVLKMELLGAEIRLVEHGQKTLKDAVNEALREWSRSYETTHYCLGSALGPEPFPEMVKIFQSVIGLEAKEQVSPDIIVACVGGGSNAIGMFTAFLDSDVELIGVEAEGAARLTYGRPGVFHGTYSYLLQNDEGQIKETHSISAGLDYPGVGPEHAILHEAKRVQYVTANDDEVMEAFKLLARTEGIIPALESAHALAYVAREGKNWDKGKIVLINLSGRGDKDL